MGKMVKKFKYSWPIEATMDIIGGKWKPLIIYNLKDGTLRFSHIMGRVQPKITQRMLTKDSAKWSRTVSSSGRFTPRSRRKWNILSRKRQNH